MKLILTDDVSDVAPDVMLFTKARLAEILEFLIDGEGPDRAAELQRAPVRNEQKCPSCKADCLPIADDEEHFCPACGTSLGISKRSFGG